MSKIVVVSTLTAPVRYQSHSVAGAGAAPEIVQEVLVRGGAGLADRHFETRGAVETVVTREEADFLAKHWLFQTHQKNGFVKIVENTVDAEAVAADMSARDGSAPLTPSDLEAKASGPKPMDGKKK